MQKIIPALNAENLEDILNLLDKSRDFLKTGDWVHLDVADGIYTGNKTWGDPDEFELKITENFKYKYEIHLMVENPDEEIKRWIKNGVGRIIVHAEKIKDISSLISLCGSNDIELSVSIGPEVDIGVIDSYIDSLSNIQILAVTPGLAGQKFTESSVDKISKLREKTNATIEIDGGMTEDTIEVCFDAGADVFVSASYIFKNNNPKAAFEKLENAAGG
ncbi:MAG: hypothetical protein COU07_02995 [Candidatus Harrisonbacteria bacterium CG10_big_fil_rev_8_21_14_0_10_40_38]|uniref:Ribulose-phosphate 3-epimerase n=1 Tax=Candidatus Harrisonbacteria bacterium CG10_big_fil_rev_8_21_14_0_10_40_38 TaxID=1974583 RepID=A0A2H0URQ4_9BACT|nr:MAG: hypothetical protein COU07_02995 [Candidatus Harrisonbacteria bacterium CG10_big_fil_rev_8_21_14_0_10_40_38]